MGRWVQILGGWVFVMDITRGLKRRTFLLDGHIAILVRMAKLITRPISFSISVEVISPWIRAARMGNLIIWICLGVFLFFKGNQRLSGPYLSHPSHQPHFPLPGYDKCGPGRGSTQNNAGDFPENQFLKKSAKPPITFTIVDAATVASMPHF